MDTLCNNWDEAVFYSSRWTEFAASVERDGSVEFSVTEKYPHDDRYCHLAYEQLQRLAAWAKAMKEVNDVR